MESFYGFLDIGIIVADANSNIIEYLNSAALKLMKMKKKDLMDKDIRNITNLMSNYSIDKSTILGEKKIIVKINSNVITNSLFEKGPMVVFKWKNTSKWPIEYVSSNVKEILGYDSEKLISNNINYGDLIYIEDITRIRKEFGKNIKLGKDSFINKPYRIITKSRKYIWVSEFINVIRDESGEIKYFLGYINDISETINMEKELINKELKNNAIINAANIGTWEWDYEIGYIKRNNKWFEMLGYMEDDFSQEERNLFHFLCHPDDIERSYQELQDHFDNKKDYYEVENRVKKKNGDWLWVLDKGKVIEYTKRGTPKKLFGVHIDINKQKIIEERFKSFMNSANEVFMILDRDLNVIELNRAGYEFLPENYTCDDVIGLSFPEVYPYVMENGIEQYHKVLKTGETVNRVKKTITPKGKEKYIYVSIFTISEGIGVISRDVTENKLRQEKIKQMNNDLRKILSSSTFGVAIVGNDRKIKWANNATLDIIGMNSIEQIKGKYCKNILCGSKKRECPIYDEKKILDNTECKLKNVKGEEIDILKSSTFIEYEGEKVVLETFIDISKIKKAEQKALMASQAKSSFLANMSHEIRTPLNGIIGFTDILIDLEENQKNMEYLNIIRESGKALLEIINDILDFSKIEAGKMEINKTKVFLNSFIENIIDIVKYKAYKKGLDIIFDLDLNGHEIVYADSSKLKQVLINLLGNAIKFTDNGYIYIKVYYDKKLNLYNFKVKDTGIGISKEHQMKIFESFSQADPSISRKYGGTGLGLSITNKILELVNSELKIKSTKDQGSEFSFDLVLKNEKNQIKKFKNDKSVLLLCKNKIINDSIKLKLNRFGVLVKKVDSLSDLLLNIKNSNIKNAYIYLDSVDSSEKEIIKEISKYGKISLIVNNLEEEKLAYKKFNGYNINISIRPIKNEKILSGLKDDSKIINKNPVKNQSKLVEKEYNILIAEDNIINMKLIKTIIGNELSNVKIFEAKDGQEAIDIFNSNKIDLILMDIQMPKIDGYKATSIIRKKDKEIKIIALTASSFISERDYCFEIGMDDYIQKPFNRKVFFDILEKWIK